MEAGELGATVLAVLAWLYTLAVVYSKGYRDGQRSVWLTMGWSMRRSRDQKVPEPSEHPIDTDEKVRLRIERLVRRSKVREVQS